MKCDAGTAVEPYAMIKMTRLAPWLAHLSGAHAQAPCMWWTAPQLEMSLCSLTMRHSCGCWCEAGQNWPGPLLAVLLRTLGVLLRSLGLP